MKVSCSANGLLGIERMSSGNERFVTDCSSMAFLMVSRMQCRKITARSSTVNEMHNGTHIHVKLTMNHNKTLMSLQTTYDKGTRATRASQLN